MKVDMDALQPIVATGFKMSWNQLIFCEVQLFQPSLNFFNFINLFSYFCIAKTNTYLLRSSSFGGQSGM